jgi:hypothetical protein
MSLKIQYVGYNKIETISSIKIIYITNKMSKCEHGLRKTYCKECGGGGLCEHDKRRTYCKECGGGGLCDHGKDKSKCKDCGGSAFCEHGKTKSICKHCGGGGLCEHGKRRTYCKECGGSSICEHGKSRAGCKECGDSSICEHGKSRTACKECGGCSICQHGKFKQICKECGGSSICQHGKVKSKCRECDGSAFCKHGKSKQICKECGGSSICQHGKIKYVCKECGGSSICEHGKEKSKCRECGGSAFCEHDKWKSNCKECGGSSLCKSSWCHTRPSNTKYEGYCLFCYVNMYPDKPNTRNYKTKEKDVVDRITQTFNNFTWVADKKVQDGCSRRRPDLLLDMGSHIIIMEVDENKHTDYDCSCEHKRLMELSQDLQHRPIIFIRFNPDDYTNQEGILVKSCWKLNKLGVMQITKTKQKEWEERIEALKQQIQYWIDNPTEKTIEIVELFY